MNLFIFFHTIIIIILSHSQQQQISLQMNQFYPNYFTPTDNSHHVIEYICYISSNSIMLIDDEKGISVQVKNDSCPEECNGMMYQCGQLESVTNYQYGNFSFVMKYGMGIGMGGIQTSIRFYGKKNEKESILGMNFYGKNVMGMSVFCILNGEMKYSSSVVIDDVTIEFKNYTIEWSEECIKIYIEGEFVSGFCNSSWIPHDPLQLLIFNRASDTLISWLGQFEYHKEYNFYIKEITIPVEGNNDDDERYKFGWIIVTSVIVLLLLVVVVILGLIGFFYLKKGDCLKDIMNSQDGLLKDQFDKIEVKEAKRAIASFKINKELFKVKMSELKVVKKLGKGGFCNVYLVRWKNIDAAFKSFDTSFICEGEENFELFERELTLISSLSHLNLPRFYGAVCKVNRTGYLMEYCSKGSLDQYIKKYKVNFQNKIRIAKEICNSLLYLHDKGVIHRDLKPENILLDENDTVKIIDFGLSLLQDKKSAAKTQNVGTSIYMAPEVFKVSTRLYLVIKFLYHQGTKYNRKVDVFSFGLIFYELITENFTPYGQMSSQFGLQGRVANDETFRPDLNSIPNDIQKNYSVVANIIENSWSADSRDRHEFAEIFSQLDKIKFNS